MSEDRITRRTFVRDSAVTAAGVAAIAGTSLAAAQPDTKKILNYNEDMEYRRCGKTNLMVSSICLGGHWKRVNVMKQDFDKNRHEVVSRCIDVGMNYIDACCRNEVVAYSKALKGRRDKMYLALSYCGKEVRNPKFRTAKALMESFDSLLKEAKEDYIDLWRITCFEPGGLHTHNTACEIVEALETAKKQGKARFIGISSHDRRWLEMMMTMFPEQIEVVITPYTAKTRKKPTGSFFDTVKKCDAGLFGIKPFASNSLFKGTSAPGDPHEKEDNQRARLAIRYILCNPVMTAPIPGLISIAQVDNMATAMKERKQHDLAGRMPEEHYRTLADATEGMWDRLPPGYQWLKEWECV